MNAKASTINYIGTWTLFKKEVRRFLKVYNQTLLAPVITSLLFLAVFSLSLGARRVIVGNISFGEFMASGLIIMTVGPTGFCQYVIILHHGQGFRQLGGFADAADFRR